MDEGLRGLRYPALPALGYPLGSASADGSNDSDAEFMQ
jgi:hypothetical protein